MMLGDERARTAFAMRPNVSALLCAGLVSLSTLWASGVRAETADDSCKRPPPSSGIVNTVPQPKPFVAAVAGLDGRSGLRPVYLDERTGRVLIVLQPPA